MTTALAHPIPHGVLVARRRKDKSAMHCFALSAVWVTVASSAIVFSEPAPVDALTMGLCVLLPVIGLTRMTPWLAGGLAAWFVIASCGYIAAMQSPDMQESTTHITVSFYLYIACVIFAAFVAKAPERHARLMLNAYLVAATVAALAGIIGYFDLISGSYDLFTKYDRATGTFKDPNVFGPFLIAGLLTAVHLWLERPTHRGILPLAAAVLITLATLFTFSRGAWGATAIAFAIYAILYLTTAERNRERLKIAGLVVGGTAVVGLLLVAALQSDAAANLLEQRATLTQPYDEGPEGRFGGQEKAFHLILENPLGIGAQVFTHYHHHEEAHNVYLTAMLNGGWIGGLTYLLLTILTLGLGWRHALKATKTQRLFLIAYAALAANILEGYIIDSDHWRHIYLLTGLVWGLMAGDPRAVRNARIVRDCRPILMSRVLVVPPSRRGARIVRTVRPPLPPPMMRPRLGAPHPRRSQRPAQIVAT
jgi:O-antigen ligase